MIYYSYETAAMYKVFRHQRRNDGCIPQRAINEELFMAKYKICKEFFPLSHFTPPISEKFLAIAVPHMKTLKFIFKDKALAARIEFMKHFFYSSNEGER